MKPFQINIDIKTHLNEKTLWKVTWNNQKIKKLHKFYKTPRNLQSLGRFLVTLPFPTPESFLPPYERLDFAKRATIIWPQSLIELICGLTRRQESSRIPQTLTLRIGPHIFLDVSLDWLLVCQFILTVKNVSSYHLKLTNNICNKTRSLIRCLQ